MEDRYIPSANAGMRRSAANTGHPANTGNSANMSRMSNSGNAVTPNSTSHMMASPNTGAMPNITANPNMGAMPEMTAKPIMGAMPYMNANPNMSMMPEMAAKPNMGAMPFVAAKPNSNTQADMAECGYKNGELPSCAPLAAGFIPFQQKNPPKYDAEEALTRGTLFPGLDLPFMNITNKTNPYVGTPMGELMALGFVIKELNLYLDTHMKDIDALDMLQSLNKLMQEGQEKFIEMFGPQSIMDITSGDEYTWPNNPWPWEYTDKGASK